MFGLCNLTYVFNPKSDTFTFWMDRRLLHHPINKQILRQREGVLPYHL